MKNFLLILLCCVTFTASATQAVLEAGYVGSNRFAAGVAYPGCASLTYTPNGTRIAIDIFQQSAAKGAATVTAFAIIEGSDGSSIRLETSYADVSIAQKTTQQFVVGLIPLALNVQYSFTFGATVCYTQTNCDSNSNNQIDNGFTVCARPLPVELIAFNAKPVDNQVHISWATASEKNAARFEVESSADGRNFKLAKTVEATGHSTSRRDYSCTVNWDNKQTYYRLRSVDTDGTFAYSNVLAVKSSEKTTQQLLVGKENRFVAFDIPANEKPTTIAVVDLLGRVMYTQEYDSRIRYEFNDREMLLRLYTDSGNVYTKLYH